MGLILDSGMLVAAERQGKNAGQMLAAISAETGDTEVAVSVVTHAYSVSGPAVFT